MFIVYRSGVTSACIIEVYGLLPIVHYTSFIHHKWTR